MKRKHNIRWNAQKPQTKDNQLNDEEKTEKANDKLQKMKKDRLNDVDDVDAPRLLRAVSYVCMVPKSKVQSQGFVRERIRAFETNSTMSHSPHDGRILFTPPELKGRSAYDVEDKLISSLIGVDMLSSQQCYNE